MAAVLAVLGLGAGIAAREAGWLEKTDLAAYDGLVQGAHPPPARVAVILESEADLQRFGHPLSDEVLAGLIERVLAGGANAVVIDKYRDKPQEPGSERLASLLARGDRIFWLRRIADDRGVAVRPPAPLEGTPFAACGDTVMDADGRVRRHLLSIDDGQGTCPSLAFAALRHVLERSGTKAGFDGEGALILGNARVAPIDPGQGPYVTADLAGFQVPVEYGERPAPRSLSAVMDGAVPAAEFRDKTVFFGSSAESLRDFFDVPGPAGRITGVEVHAAAFAHLHGIASGEREPLRLAPRWLTWVLMALAAAAASLVVVVPRRGASVLVVAVAALVLWLLAWAEADKARYFVPFVPPLAVLVLTATLAFAARAWREQAERAELMNLFSRQVSPEVAESIWKQRDQFYRDGRVPTQDLYATVFFMDIRGFTTVTESLGKETVPWLNRGLGVMTDIVIRHLGVVTRFVGDQIMSVHGVPVGRRNEHEVRADARAAVTAAVKIGHALKDLNRSFESEGLPPIRVRIGINTGDVTQGTVGSSLRFDFTVLGDAVNTAARLESYPSPDDGAAARVLIGEATYKLCGEHFQCEHFGDLQLKGKDKVVRVYRVFGEAGKERMS